MELVRALVTIDDSVTKYSSILLHQFASGHHRFTIRIEQEASKGLLTRLADQYIGKQLQLAWGFLPDQDLLESIAEIPPDFVGVITEVKMAYGNNSKQQVILIGYGLTILLDEGPNTRSFSEKGIKEIVDEILKEYKGRINPIKETPAPSIKPAKGDTLEYVVQYKESNLDFLYRLAAQNGEWFYYNGLQIFLGKPSDENSSELIYGQDLRSFDLSVKAVPTQFKLIGYDYLSHEFPEIGPTNNEKELSSYAQIAYKKSKEELFTNVPLAPVIQSIDENQIEHLARLRQNLQTNEMVIASGVSSNPDLQIGGLFDLIAENRNGQIENHGSYIVTELLHDFGGDGSYLNQFEAIPSQISTPPFNPTVQPPFCETQVAEVKDNNDEKSLGRVRVSFSWQQGTEELSPWLRVSSPFTGQDKGFYIIPEVGDQVLVDFEHHNPSKPYVLGGFYHQQNKPEFSDKDNNIKSIKTRGGNQIMFNDKDGEELITISNPGSKNEITLSLSDKPMIAIRSEGDISISGKDISISGSNLSLSADEKVGISGDVIGTNAQSKIEVNSKAVKINADESTVVASSGTVDIKSKQDTSILAAQIKLNSP